MTYTIPTGEDAVSVEIDAAREIANTCMSAGATHTLVVDGVAGAGSAAWVELPAGTDPELLARLRDAGVSLTEQPDGTYHAKVKRPVQRVLELT